MMGLMTCVNIAFAEKSQVHREDNHGLAYLNLILRCLSAARDNTILINDYTD